MASNAYSTPAPAEQPGLRAFIVYSELPLGTAAYPVMKSSSEPLLSIGEIVVVDPHDCEPSLGELFLIQWDGGTVDIVTCWWTTAAPGTSMHNRMWVGPYRKTALSNICGGVRSGDGPYRTEVLATKLLGRVIGILEPEVVEPLRLAA